MPAIYSKERYFAAEIMRFVRGAQGMTHSEIAWFMDRILPIVERAIKEEREECAKICEGQIDSFEANRGYGPEICAEAIRTRSNVELTGAARHERKTKP